MTHALRRADQMPDEKKQKLLAFTDDVVALLNAKDIKAHEALDCLLNTFFVIADSLGLMEIALESAAMNTAAIAAQRQASTPTGPLH